MEFSGPLHDSDYLGSTGFMSMYIDFGIWSYWLSAVFDVVVTAIKQSI